MARVSGRPIWAIAVFGALSLGGLAAAGAVMVPGRQDAAVAPSERPAQPVRVSVIRFAAVGQVARYTGTIRPRHEVGMGFRVPGKIVSRSVEVGDRVVRGQVLARLDDTDARLERELAEAEAEAARVDHRRALAEVERSGRLFAEGHVAQAALDRAVSVEAEAAARLDRAVRASDLAGNRLGYAQLVAEVDGVVTATPGEVGQVVSAGLTVVSVAQAGALDVVFALPETERGHLAAGVARGTVWGEGGDALALRLRDISPDVDPVGRTYRVRMGLEAPAGAVALGRTVTVEVDLAAQAPAAAVPLAAVIDDGTGPGVWRVQGDRVERVAVEVVSISGEVARIRGALGEGDAIVSLGAQKVDPGRPVRVVETRPMAEG